jgi:hypothetical protein
MDRIKTSYAFRIVMSLPFTERRCGLPEGPSRSSFYGVRR